MKPIEQFAARYAKPKPRPALYLVDQSAPFPVAVPNPAVSKPTHAWVSLVRLCGVNIKALVEYRGKSAFVTAQDHTYRVDAAKFIAGERQYRDGWCIEQWGEKAERTAKAEANWQT